MTAATGIIRIRGQREGEPAALYPCGVPGLAINRDPVSGWNITHTRSGCALAWFPDADPEAVLAAAAEIGDIADWTAPGSALIHLRWDVEDAVTPWGGGTVAAAGVDHSDLEQPS